MIAFSLAGSRKVNPLFRSDHWPGERKSGKMRKLSKKDQLELRKIEDKLLNENNPELNQSIYDTEGNKTDKANWEQFSYIPMGFINSGIIYCFPGKNVLAIYLYLSTKCNKWRNTRVETETIIKDTGLSMGTIKDVLRVLEFYHLISRRKYYIGKNKKRRIITLLKWSTAYKKLIEEGKIKAHSADDIYFIMPYQKKLPIKGPKHTP